MMAAAMTTAKLVMSMIVVTLLTGYELLDAHVIGEDTIRSLDFGCFGVIKHANLHHCFLQVML